MSGILVIYVGGGCDGYCGSDYTIVQRYAARKRNSRFFMHFETAAIRASMETARKQGNTLVIIGHSWGGDAVIDLLRDGRVPRPDLTVTVDPVGKSVSFGLGRSHSFGGLWVNITARDDAWLRSGGNFVAKLWGKTHHSITGRADVQVDSRRIHEDFGGMLDDARVPEMIRTLETNARNRR